MSKWKVNYKANDFNIKQKLKIFEDFWKRIGKKYCADKNMEYIEKYVEQKEYTF